MIIMVGGNGFLGRHLSCMAHAQRLGFAVVSRRPASDFLAEHAPSGRFMAAPAFDETDGEHLIADAAAVVFLSRQSGPASNVSTPWLEVEQSCLPVFRQFERIATINPDARIVFASSGGTVYGQHDKDGALDELSSLEPISPYGLGKVLLEYILGFVGRTKPIRTSILRVANPVGVWQGTNSHNLVSAAFQALRTDIPMSIYGNGEAVRDYIDADDVATAFLLAAGDRSRESGIWNIGSGKGHSVRQVLDLVGQVTGRPVPTRTIPGRETDVDQVVLDPSSFSRKFDWMPGTDLVDTIRKINTHISL